MVKVELLRADSPRFEMIRGIRRAVFVEEQGVSPANEFDAIDEEAVHFLASSGGVAVGTARLYGEGAAGRIGRVAVVASCRGQGVGAALMRRTLEEAVRQGYGDVVLHAQTRVEGFYAGLGFRPEGEAYEEEGIVHITMRTILQPFRAI